MDFFFLAKYCTYSGFCPHFKWSNVLDKSWILFFSNYFDIFASIFFIFSCQPIYQNPLYLRTGEYAAVVDARARLDTGPGPRRKFSARQSAGDTSWASLGRSQPGQNKAAKCKWTITIDFSVDRVFWFRGLILWCTGAVLREVDDSPGHPGGKYNHREPNKGVDFVKIWSCNKVSGRYF